MLDFDKSTGTITGAGKNIKEIEIPKTIDGVVVTTISAGAFWQCKTLTLVRVPATIKNIGDEAFAGCLALEKIIVDKDNPNFKDIAGVLFTKDGKKVLAYPNSWGISYEIPAGIVEIGESAFAWCENLQCEA